MMVMSLLFLAMLLVGCGTYSIPPPKLVIEKERTIATKLENIKGS